MPCTRISAPIGKRVYRTIILPTSSGKLHEIPPGKLPLDDAEFRLARNALNNLRNQRIATGGYTDAADDALIKLFKAKPPLWPFG